MTTAWITGAAGFIGRHAARAMAERGARVGGVGIGPWEVPYGHWGISDWVEGAIQGAALERLAERTGSPSVVLHLAGGSAVGPSFTAPLADFERSVDSTACLLEWVRMNAPRASVVCASSAAVYGVAHANPIPATGHVAPTSPYGFHKRMVELLCESYANTFGVRTSVVRLFSVYGPELRKQLLWDLCRKLASSPDRVALGGTGAEVRDWVHVTAAVEYLIEAVDAPSTFTVRNGGTGRGTTVSAIAGHVKAAWRSGAEIVFTGERRPGDPDYLVAEASGRLGRTAAPEIADGIREYVEWFRRGGA